MIHYIPRPCVDPTICEPPRLFARHVTTRTWHLLCSNGKARCNRAYRLDAAKQVEIPPDDGEPCWACVVNSGFYKEFEVKRALHRFAQAQKVPACAS